MIIEEVISFPLEHPALAGHFPGNPIVPGVVLLDHAAGLAFERGGWQVTAIRAAKFRQTLSPGTDCSLRLVLRQDGALDLTCSAAGKTILTAILEGAARTKSP